LKKKGPLALSQRKLILDEAVQLFIGCFPSEAKELKGNDCEK